MPDERGEPQRQDEVFAVAHHLRFDDVPGEPGVDEPAVELAAVGPDPPVHVDDPIPVLRGRRRAPPPRRAA